MTSVANDLQGEVTTAKGIATTAQTAADNVGTRLTTVSEALEGELNIKANASDLQATNVAVGHSVDELRQADQFINRKVSDNSAAIQQNADSVTAVAGGVVANRIAVAGNTNTIKANSSQIVTLRQGLQQAQTTGEYVQSHADAAYANTQANHQALVTTNKAVANHSAELANHESRIQTLEADQGYGNRFAKLKNQVDDNRKRASAGISGVAAMANIPQVIQGQTFAVGAGAGATDGESALAVGFSARATDHVVVKASLSDDTQQNFVIGTGVSYGW